MDIFDSNVLGRPLLVNLAKILRRLIHQKQFNYVFHEVNPREIDIRVIL